MGIPFYGQSFTLADSGSNSLNANSSGPGEAGKYTKSSGFLAFYEICEKVKNGGWSVSRDPIGRVGPYASHGDQWVSYDDISDVKRKGKVIKNMNLGGGAIWALDLDDFSNKCNCGNYPLLKTLNEEIVSDVLVQNCT